MNAEAQTPNPRFVVRDPAVSDRGPADADCVRLEGVTLWLNQQRMAELSETSVPNINIHIRNPFEERELQPE